MRYPCGRRGEPVLSEDLIQVERGFDLSPDFLLARGAVQLCSEAGDTRVLTGAAGGIGEATVRLRALGELIEHTVAYLAGRCFDGTRASCRELAARTPVLAPRELTHFDAATSAQFDPIDDEIPLSFCAGVALADGQRVLVPALLCFASYRPIEAEPIFIKPGGTGLAAHTRSAAATRHALLEVLERDACMLSWRVPHWPCRSVEPASLPEALLTCCERLGLVAELYDVGEPGLVPVLVCLLSCPDGRQLTVGSCAGWDLTDTAARALNEALMLQWTLARYGALHAGHEQPTTSLQHVLSAARRGPEVREWYRRQASGRREWTSTTEPDQLEALAQCVEGRLGGRVVAVSLGGELTVATGWSVVRVVVSNAQPRESDSRTPHLGGRRMLEALQRWSGAGQHIQAAPHPFG